MIHGAVHSESRNSIILTGIHIGGCNIYHIFAEFSLSADKWVTWKCPCSPYTMDQPLGELGMVCTENGRYLITFGGDIIVHDLERRTSIPIVSELQYPIKAEFHSLMMTDVRSDEVLTFGFIRLSFEEREMKGVQLPPYYMLQMMAKWVETEWVHLLQRKGKGHWKVRLNAIMPFWNL